MTRDTGTWIRLGDAVEPVVQRLAGERGLTEPRPAPGHVMQLPLGRTGQGLRGRYGGAGTTAVPRGGDGFDGRSPVSAAPSACASTVQNELRDVLGEITATNRALLDLAKAMTPRRPSRLSSPDPRWEAQSTEMARLRLRLIELKIKRAAIEGSAP